MTRSLPPLLATAALSLTIACAKDEESGFDGALPTGWTIFDPYGNATVDSSGGTLSLFAPAPPDVETAELFGPARVAVLAEEEREDTQICADVTSWPETYRIPGGERVNGTFVAVMTRGRDTDGFSAGGGEPPGEPQPATVTSYVDGYSLSFIDLGTGSARLQLHRIDDEWPTLIAPLVEGSADFSLAGVTKIGLTLSSRGSYHYGEARDLTPGTGGPYPVASVSATDATYPSGQAGVLTTTDRLIPVSAGFDHVVVWDARLPQPAMRHQPAEGWFELVADRRRTTALSVQTRTNLADPADPWVPAPPDSWAYEGDDVVLRYSMDEPRRFFRFVSE